MQTQTSGRAASFRLRGREGEWRVDSDGGVGMAYASKEAAFEAAVAAASNAIRDGYDVTITVPGASETMLGVADTGRGADAPAVSPENTSRRLT
ncbi:hypothetical protein KHC23_00940 [Ancylobacter dichloromethanicus]|uniref:DUF2188 domain-containing protein n=1 Tax=Ancylobacter dichloromethanicus TaxID=518825 RepID=A0A9W6N1B0_9HYPH|nr:hypothetical protein [Ancylobacter dichloromethanicus]MBS7552225.1 hypothetical protein [Ancylobacter dichloromethanicus]GLK73960.1 hypothetical protein GCM10017643_40780 [Ancylobacter dichloromethanicus]